MYSVFASVESAVCFIRASLLPSPDYCLCQLTRVYNCFTHVGLSPYTCLNLQWWSVSLANIYFLFNLPVSTGCLARDNAYSTRLSVWHVPHPSLQAIPLSWVYSLFDTHESILELSWLSLQYLCSTALQVWGSSMQAVWLVCCKGHVVLSQAKWWAFFHMANVPKLNNWPYAKSVWAMMSIQSVASTMQDIFHNQMRGLLFGPFCKPLYLLLSEDFLAV